MLAWFLPAYYHLTHDQRAVFRPMNVQEFRVPSLAFHPIDYGALISLPVFRDLVLWPHHWHELV